MTDLSDRTIDVTSWSDLAGLPQDMALLDAQFRQLSDHARQWVCNKQGFAPSPVCLLQPLGEFMDWLAEAVTAAEHVVHGEWGTLSDGVAAATTELQWLDQYVADALPVVS